jgi:FkbM family methyltransferase
MLSLTNYVGEEPTVQLALNDLVKPGDFVLDAGAHLGRITESLSHLVGPEGLVLAFEASSQIMIKLRKKISSRQLHNVYPYHVAVSDRDGLCRLFVHNSHDGSSTIKGLSEEYLKNCEIVHSISLDLFLKKLNLSRVPSLVKLDIEGAEYEALIGMQNLIDRHFPHLILEQGPGLPCLQFLLEKGYIAIDLASYQLINKLEDLIHDSFVYNVLFIHKSKIDDTPYRNIPFELNQLQTIPSDFFELKRGSWLQKEPITLNPGRYLIYFDFDSDNTKVNCHMGIKGIFSYKATPKTLMSYRNFMCHFFRPQEIVTFYNFDPKSFFEKLGTKQVDPSFSNHGIKIFKVANWPKEAPLSLKDLVGCVR